MSRRAVQSLDPMPSMEQLRAIYRERTGKELHLAHTLESQRMATRAQQLRANLIVADERGWLEHQHQVRLFEWADEHAHRWPELALLFAIPNGHGIGRTTKAQGARSKREGRKAGVPDICLPVARGEFHGLYIELKRIDGKPSDVQLEWRAQLRAQKYRAEIIEGWQPARHLIVEYLGS